MSNLLFMDESNGNGVYASKGNSTASNTNNINNIMTAGTTAAIAAPTLPASVSNEDLSQSLSEYTDADESISAPTEFLAEFLSAVMLKDYKKALKYCKLILQYEPNNATAKEFYPLIQDKLRAASSDSDENYNKSSSPEMLLEMHTSDPSTGESDEAPSDNQQTGVDDGVIEYGVSEDISSGEPNSNDSNVSSCCGSAPESLSESEDIEEDDDVDDEEEDEEEDEDEEDDVNSSSGDDLPIDDQQGSVADDGMCTGNDTHSSGNSSSGGEGRSRSDNTTHSYSSLLLEEEDDIVPVSLHFSKELCATDLDVSNGNKMPSASCSDSESPTEPLTQRLAAILRSKCGVSNNVD